MRKRGSHVGMVLSFVVFITFLFLLWTVLSPAVNVEQGKKNLLNYLKISLIDNLSVNVTIATIRINEGVSKNADCFEIDDFGYNGKVQVKDEISGDVTSDNSGGKLKISWDENKKFYKIYYSAEIKGIPVSLFGCRALLKESEYVVGSVAASKYISESELNNLKQNYDNDYERLKLKYNFPNESEFDFQFTSEGITIVEAIKEQTAQNVYAEEIPVQYVDDNANINYGFLKLRVW